MKHLRGTIVSLLRCAVLDADLAALVWLLLEGSVPTHVVAPDRADADSVAVALRELAGGNVGAVTSGVGGSLEDVVRLPVPLRPATGVVIVLRDDRVAAAHLLRPPLRDAGGHVRPQAPAVLATWDGRDRVWEHFAWALAPELGEAVGRPAGDVEIEQGRRREYLDALATAGLDTPEQLQAALAGYRLRAG